MAMQNKLMEGLGMFALLEDSDGAGYLGHEDAAAVQRARVDFGAFREGLAAEYLQKDAQAELAKQRLRHDIRKIEAGTETGKFSDEEAALFDRYSGDIGEAIDRLASKPGWQRAIILWFFRTPGIIKVVIVAVAIAAIAILFGKVLAK
jgi:hypothetical protein